MINWIDDNLAVGDVEDAKQHQELRKLGIGFIIDIRNVFDGSIAVGDATPEVKKVEELVDGLRLLTSKGYKVFIHCHAGIDRAPFIAMMYLLHKFNISPPAAYDIVKNKRPQTIEHWEWLEVMR